jgi:hypothetical protein
MQRSLVGSVMFIRDRDGTRHVAVAAATMEVLPGPIAGRTLRLAIGLGALAAAFLVLRFANRAARRQRAPG